MKRWLILLILLLLPNLAEAQRISQLPAGPIVSVSGADLIPVSETVAAGSCPSFPTLTICTVKLSLNQVPLTVLASIAANSFVGNNTGSSAAPVIMTQAQATALLNAFTSSLQGVVPSSGGGTTNYLRADATWANTTATQSAKDNSTKFATTAYVDAPTGLTAGTSVTLSAPRQYFICTGTCTITVPVPAAGYEFCVRNDDNVATVITFAAIGSSAAYEKTAFTSYGTAGTGTAVSGGAAGDKLCLLGRDSTHYLVASFNGTWTMN